MSNRWLIMLAGMAALAIPGCLDVRDFEGTWSGARVGEADVLRRGLADPAADSPLTASLVIERATLGSLAARLTIAGLFDDARITPIPGAEADVLATMSFDGAPARVFLAFAPTLDSGGDALVMVALYDDPRVELRVLRGGTSSEIYGIFSLQRGASAMARREVRR